MLWRRLLRLLLRRHEREEADGWCGSARRRHDKVGRLSCLGRLSGVGPEETRAGHGLLVLAHQIGEKAVASIVRAFHELGVVGGGRGVDRATGCAIGRLKCGCSVRGTAG